MFDGRIVTISWLLNKVGIIISTTILVTAVLSIDLGIWISIVLSIAVLIQAFIEWKIVNGYMKRLGGDSTWQDRQRE